MSMTRFVTSDGLPGLLAFLSQNGRRVLVPVEKPANKRSVVFEPWSQGMPFTLEKATVPPKAAVLPQCETLVRYKKSKDPENPERVTMSPVLPSLVFCILCHSFFICPYKPRSLHFITVCAACIAVVPSNKL